MKHIVKIALICCSYLLLEQNTTQVWACYFDSHLKSPTDIAKLSKRTDLVRPEQQEIWIGGEQKVIDRRYFLTKVPTSPDNELVWHRVTSSGNSDDVKVLAIGYENTPTDWGNEGENIYFNTPGGTKTVFLSGGLPDNVKDPINSALEKRVSAEKYNHIYADFHTLNEDVPYMINAHFFDYIVIGPYTERYITKASTLTACYSMLKNTGIMIIPILHYIEENGYLLDKSVFPESDKELYISSVDSVIPFLNTISRYNISGKRSVKTKAQYETWSAELKTKTPALEMFFSNSSPHGYVTIKRKES